MIKIFQYLPAVKPRDIAYRNKYKKDFLTLTNHNSRLFTSILSKRLPITKEVTNFKRETNFVIILELPYQRVFTQQHTFFDTIFNSFSEARLPKPVPLYTSIDVEANGKKLVALRFI